MKFLDKYLSPVLPLIDIEHIKKTMADLAEIEKPADFNSFSKSVEFLENKYASLGMESHTLKFPADGKTKYYTYTAPMGFIAESATCAIVEPEKHKKRSTVKEVMLETITTLLISLEQ